MSIDMNKSIWEWLGIEPTSNISEIKKAYSEAAKKYHPAEHPEEFRLLRDSYKKAMEYA
ncbi:MAG: DnaJ domain-containing protein, partial [Pseudobutyrivibrio sp.]|nr:DnaJ domain-containing protein [Pseudobutyrivibrio sp.]